MDQSLLNGISETDGGYRSSNDLVCSMLEASKPALLKFGKVKCVRHDLARVMSEQRKLHNQFLLSTTF